MYHLIFNVPKNINAIVHINYVIEGTGALVNEKGEETPKEGRRLCPGQSR